uniref:Integrase catalytic domain-containing protein n=1 Tax=Tanacetum cinerariifolium TaxID=118510 RepID=A0A6L2NWR9_TANCI|nr:hypothetical protein [Tanacetum cinerariifolium]
MDLCGPMHVASINGKKYIIIIVDDYSQFTWVKFLASKDEALAFIIKFLKMIQVRLNATVGNIHLDNGTEFVNQTLRDYYEQVGIYHETSIARTPQQNGVVERRNHTLVKAAHIIKPDLSYIHVFRALCYPNNDSENLEKLQAKPDIGIFIGYVTKKKDYRIYNRRTQKIIKTIHVDFDELTAMAFEQLGSGPGLQSSVASPVPIEEAPPLVESTNLPSSTTVDQDAPSPSTSQTTPQSQSQTIPLSAEEESYDFKLSHISNDPYFGILIPETVYEESSSSDFIPTTVHSNAPILEHLTHGYRQQEGIDFEESFAPVARLESVWIFLAFASHMNMIVYLMDISQSPRGIFLNQSIYALESLKKYIMESCNPVDTPMVKKSKPDENTQGKAVDPTHWHPHHIDIRYHFIKGRVENGFVELYFVKTQYQLADIFTKALCRERIEFLIDNLGMRSFTLETLKELADEAEE